MFKGIFLRKGCKHPHILKRALTSNRLRPTILRGVGNSKLGFFKNVSAVAEKNSLFYTRYPDPPAEQERGSKTTKGLEATAAGGGALPLETRKRTKALKKAQGLRTGEGRP